MSGAPGFVWLQGLKSEMVSTKATALAAWCAEKGYACTRFDYSGHGRSDGKFEEAVIGDWLEEAHAVLAQLTPGPQILVGSSTGGYVALLVLRDLIAQQRQDRIKALTLIAPAWDMTEAPAKPKKEFVPVPPGSYESAAIVLLTDGRRTTGVDPQEAARLAADRGIRVYSVGLGTLDGEVPGFEGWSMYLKLDEPSLKAIANATAAEYYYASDADALRISRQAVRRIRAKVFLLRQLGPVHLLFDGVRLIGRHHAPVVDRAGRARRNAVHAQIALGRVDHVVGVVEGEWLLRAAIPLVGETVAQTAKGSAA